MASETERLFHNHYVYCRVLGIMVTKRYQNLFKIYSVFLNISITLGYPIHLVMGLFQIKTLFEILKNLAINLACLVCSLKIFIFWPKLKNNQKMLDIIKRLDKRVAEEETEDELHYYKHSVLPAVKRVHKIYQIMYFSAWFMSVVCILIEGSLGNWRMLHPAYFPFDTLARPLLLVAALLYQLIGLAYQILQDLLTDSFVPMHMAYLSGQVHILSLKVAKLGNNTGKSLKENNQELLKCIQDHKDLLKYRRLLEKFVSHYMLFQVFFTSCTMCIIVVFTVLFVEDFYSLVYYFIFLLCISFEIFPACYYGTILEMEFHNLTYALFSCNWQGQNKAFLRNFLIFAEQTKKPLNVMAWLFPINLDTFMEACKNSYSLFAVIMNMK